MPVYPYRDLQPTAEAEELYRRWISYLDEEFTKHKQPALRAEIVRDNLHQLYLGRPHGGKLNFTLTSELPGNVLQLSFDPCNVTLEPEYYGDVDKDKIRRAQAADLFLADVRPLAGGAESLAGLQVSLHAGPAHLQERRQGVKIFHGVEFSYGYNLTIEDNVVIHKYVMLDDRGEIILRKGTSLSDYAAVYSHSHDPIDSAERDQQGHRDRPLRADHLPRLVMAGQKVGEDSIVGAHGVVTHEVEAHSIVGGVPCKEAQKQERYPALAQAISR
jgi:acetyltransferase-like isoleucine patch superfamily enzyme